MKLTGPTSISSDLLHQNIVHWTSYCEHCAPITPPPNCTTSLATVENKAMLSHFWKNPKVELQESGLLYFAKILECLQKPKWRRFFVTCNDQRSDSLFVPFDWLWRLRCTRLHSDDPVAFTIRIKRLDFAIKAEQSNSQAARDEDCVSTVKCKQLWHWRLWQIIFQLPMLGSLTTKPTTHFHPYPTTPPLTTPSLIFSKKNLWEIFCRIIPQSSRRWMQAFDQSALKRVFSRSVQNITDLRASRPSAWRERYFFLYFNLCVWRLTLGLGEVFGENLMCKGDTVLLQIGLVVVNFIEEVVVVGIRFPAKKFQSLATAEEICKSDYFLSKSWKSELTCCSRRTVGREPARWVAGQQCSRKSRTSRWWTDRCTPTRGGMSAASSIFCCNKRNQCGPFHICHVGLWELSNRGGEEQWPVSIVLTCSSNLRLIRETCRPLSFSLTAPFLHFTKTSFSM